MATNVLLTDFVAYSSSQVTLSGEALVTQGIVGSANDVTIGPNSRSQGLTGGGDLAIGADSVVDGPITFNGTSFISVNTVVQGSINSGDSVTLAPDVIVTGDVTSAQSVLAHPTVNVAGTVTEFGSPEDFEAVDLPDKSDFDIVDGDDIDVNKGEQLGLPPGVYGSLEMQRDSTLLLSSGSYFFELIDAGRELELSLDLQGGEIAIFVDGEVDIDRNFMMSLHNGDASDVYVEIHGDFQLGQGSQLHGTYFAPDDDIKIDRDSMIVGALYGESIHIAQNTLLELVPSTRLVGDNSPPSVSATLANDTGASNSDGVTSDPAIAGSITDESDISQFTLAIPELSVGPTDVLAFVDSTTGAFAIDSSDLEALVGQPLGDGTYTLTFESRDEHGNQTFPVQLIVTLDTTSPLAPMLISITDDTGSAGDDQITRDNTLLISGTSEVDTFITISDPLLGAIGNATSDASGTWTVDNTNSVISDGSYTLTGTAEDVAGNVSDTSAPLVVLIDTAPPDPPTIDGIEQDTGQDGGDGITNDNRLVISGTADAGSTVDVRSPTLGPIGSVVTDPTGVWALDLTGTALNDGMYGLVAQAEDVAGNLSATSTTFTIQVDTIAPTIQSLDLDPAFDTDPVGDQTTTLDNVGLVGTTEPNTAVQLLETGATTSSDASGQFSFDNVSLQVGDNPFTARATDIAGNAQDAAVTITRQPGIDDQPPQLSAALANDTGPDDTDGITSDPTILGNATDQSSVSLFFFVEVQTLNDFFFDNITFLLQPNGDFTIDQTTMENIIGQPLVDGFYDVYIDAEDEFLNFSSVNVPFVYISSAQPPIITGIEDDTGISDSDAITSDNRLLISGTSQPSSSVTLAESTLGIIGSTVADVFGNWTVDATQLPLSDGTYHFTASVESTQSPPFQVMIDTGPPSIHALRLTPATDTGAQGDFQTTLDLVTLEGRTEPNARVQIVQTGNETTAGNDGLFQLSNVPLGLGRQPYTLLATDIAGNVLQRQQIITRSASLLLSEDTGLVQEASLLVDLGQQTGTRTLSFRIDTSLDVTDQSSPLEDTLLVYLLDPADTARTLLDRGELGTSLIMLSGDQIEYPPGLVSHDGSVVQIDVTSVTDVAEGELRFQLINVDADSTTQVSITQVTNLVEGEGIENSQLDIRRSVLSPGDVLNLSGMAPSTDVDVIIENVRLDSSSGNFAADVRLHNSGSPIGRNVAVVFPGLPAAIDLTNASGTDASGAPYVNMRDSIPPGGLPSGETSEAVRLEISNPSLVHFQLSPTILSGGPNQPPSFDPVGPLSVFPGGFLEAPLTTTDPDDDPISIRLKTDGSLPNMSLSGNGLLTVSPSPAQVGTYQFDLIASDGSSDVQQTVTLDVPADPVTTTRISGVVLNTNSDPLVGVPIELSGDSTVTGADGTFELPLTGAPAADAAILIRGETLGGPEAYPFIAEKLPLLLGHDAYANVNNVIARPIFLPALDVTNAVTIDPSVDTTVTTPTIPDASVFVAAGTLEDQLGNPFTGQLSITEVPVDLTPAALPEHLFPDLVVTIQPGEMVFTTPAPLSLPNRAGYLPDSEMELYSINPESGEFEVVGAGRVSADGTKIDTTSGGIRNSSWHFMSARGPNGKDGHNQDKRCDDCEARKDPNAPASSGGLGGDAGGFGGGGEEAGGRGFDSDGNPRPDSGREPGRPPEPGTRESFFQSELGVLVHEAPTRPTRPPEPTPPPERKSDSFFGGSQRYDFGPSRRSSLGLTPNDSVPTATPVPDFSQDRANLLGDETSFSAQSFGYTAAQTEVALHSGAVYKRHDLAPYQSLGTWRGLTLQYDSERADPKPIVHFGFNDVTSNFPELFMISRLKIRRGNFEYLTPGYRGFPDIDGLRIGDHIFRVPTNVFLNNIDAALQADLREQPSGQYIFQVDTRFTRADFTKVVNIARPTVGKLIHVNEIDSPFGAGWGLSGVHKLVENPDESVLLIDGDGSELLFEPPIVPGGPYKPSPGDFSTFEKLPDGTFRRTMIDQTVFQFNSNNDLQSIRDRNGNETQFIYGASNRLERIVDPVGLETTFTYTGDRITKITDPATRETLLQYDAFGNLTQVTDPDNSTRTFDYGGSHRLVLEVDKRGRTERTTYDFAGRARETTRKDGSVVQYFPTQSRALYPAATTSTPGGAVTFSLGSIPFANHVDANGNVTRTELDRGGQALTISDGAGRRPSVVRNDDNLIVQSIDARGNTTLLTYDPRGNVNSISDPISRSAEAEPLFVSPVYETGDRPEFVATADVNRDGFADAVTANLFGNSISVLLGNGDGSFQSRMDFPAGDQPRAIELVDFNRDGLLDAIVANRTSDQVTVLLGDGQGNFITAQSATVGDEPYHLTLADMDADGDLDIVTANRGSNTLSVLLADGLSLSHAEYSVGTRPEWVDVADINGDGQLDVISTNSTGGTDKLSILLGNGDGTLGTSTGIDAGGAIDGIVFLRDLNSDSSPDIITKGFGEVSVLLNDGNGTFVDQTDIPLVSSPSSMTVGDIDADGDQDVIVGLGGASPMMIVLRNDGAGALSAEPNFSLPVNPDSISLTDIDLDGDLDAIVMDTLLDQIVSVLGDGDGTFITPVLQPPDLPVGDRPYSVDSADLNGDGSIDAVTANRTSDTVSVLLGNGDGSFGTQSEFPSGVDPVFVLSVDLNADNHLDLAIANFNADSVSVLLGDGTGSFGPPTTFAVADGPIDIASDDMNNDTIPDLVVTGNRTGDASFSVLLGNGDGTFAPSLDTTTNFGPGQVALGDLSGDGNVDIVVGQASFSFTNRVAVFLGNGDGTFGPGVTYAVGGAGSFPGPVSDVALADVTSNGILDILATDPSTDSVAVLPGNGNGTFDVPTLYTVGRDPRSLAVGDLDNNGTLDVITANQRDDRVSVLLGHGNGTFGGRVDFAVGDLPYSVTLDDLDGDSDLDLIVANQNDDSVSIRRNTTISESGVSAPSAKLFTHDPVFSQLIRSVDELGREILVDIDPTNGNRLSVTEVVGSLGGADDVVTQYTYTSEGLIDTVIDPLGRVTDYQYDVMGRVNRITYAVGSPDEAFESFEYDLAGNRTARIDELGHRTEFQYDELNRLTRVIEADPDGAGPLASPVTDYTYDTGGNLIAVVDALTNSTTYEYDDLNRLVSLTDADTHVYGYEYDNAGNLSAEVDRLGRRTEYRYDDRNRLVEIIDAEGAAKQFAYDPDDNAMRIIDKNGGLWLLVHDSRDRQTFSIDAHGNASTSIYDRTDNLVASIDELGRRTEMAYDDLNRLVRVTQPDPDRSGPLTAPQFQHQYDLANNVRFVTDALGNTLQYVYDDRDRIVQQIDADPDGAGPIASPVTSLQYDGANRLTSLTDPLGRTTTYQYDDLDRLVQETYPDPDGPGPDSTPQMTFTYDAAHNRTSMTDALGNTTVYGYDNLYRLVSITNPDPDSAGPLASPITTFVYDEQGQLISASDPLDRTVTYQYDQLGRLISQTRPDPDGPGPDSSPVTTFTYDGVGNQTSMTDALGNTTGYEYDALYRRTRIIESDPDGAGPLTSPISVQAYDAADQMTSFTDALGRLTSFTYDDLGRIVRETYPDPDAAGPDGSPVMTYDYDSMGNRVAMTDALRNLTQYEFDNLYRLLRVIQPDPDDAGPQTNPTSTYAYDAASQIIATTDPLGRTTGREFDLLGRVIREIQPDPDGAGPLVSPEMSYTHDLMNNRRSMTDAEGNVTQYQYDNLYRLTSVVDQDPDGAGPLTSPVTRYTYDVASQLLSVSDPLSRTTTYEYDNLARRVRTIQPDPDGAGPLASPEISYSYDLVDNQLSVTDPLGHTTTWQYDDLYRPLRRIEEDLDGAGPLGSPETQFTYDAVDNTLSLTDPVGNVTTYEYDGLDRTITETIELGPGNLKSRSYTYDAMDNLVELIDRNGRKTEFQRDNLYRVVTEQWRDPLDNLVHTMQFQFDEANQLLAAEDVTLASRHDYLHDDLGRVTQDTVNNGGQLVELAFDFNANSLRTGLTANVNGTGDFANTYTYDGLNRVARIDQQSQPVGNLVAEKRVDIAYNAASQFTDITRFKSLAAAATDEVVTTTFAYDGLGRLTDMTHSHQGSPLHDFTWTFDSSSRITRMISSIDGTSIYNYDNGDQLTAAGHDTQPNEQYTYDENGNRTNPGYSADVYNRLASNGTYDYQHDDEGNRTQRTQIASGEVTQYQWDHRNRLIQITTRNSETGPATKNLQYTYDLFDRWIGNSVDADGDGPQPAVSTHYIYDGQQITLALDDSGTVANRYLWGPVVDQILADESAGGEVLWPLTDHLGTVRDLIDSNGTNRNHRAYDTFGGLTSQSDSSVEHLLGFTGRPYDEQSGLQNNLNRWYDPQVGRWLSEDPIEFATGDANLYRYVYNVATGAIDPDGLASLGGAAEFGWAATKAVPGAAWNAFKAGPEFAGRAIGTTALQGYSQAGLAARRLGYELPGTDEAGARARARYDQHFHDMHEAAREFNGMSPSQKWQAAKNAAGNAAQAVGDWVGKFQDNYAKGCMSEAGDMFGGAFGGGLGGFGSGAGGFGGFKAAKSFCFVAGTQVALPWNTDDGSTLFAQPLNLPLLPDDNWNRRNLALAAACGIVTVGYWSQSKRRRNSWRRLPAWQSLAVSIAETTSVGRPAESSIPATTRTSTLTRGGWGDTPQCSANEASMPRIIEHVTTAHREASPQTSSVCSQPEGWGEAAAAKLTSLEHPASSPERIENTPRHSTTPSPIRLRDFCLLIGTLLTLGLFFSAAPKPESTNSTQLTSSLAPIRAKTNQPQTIRSNNPPTINIEHIEPGQIVLSRYAATGKPTRARVANVFRRQSDHLRILEIESNGDGPEPSASQTPSERTSQTSQALARTPRSASSTLQRIQTTDEHPFWVHGKGWVKAGDLDLGDRVLQSDGHLATITATTHQPHPEGVDVFNIEVAHHHTYFVTAHGARAPPVWVHNKSVAKAIKDIAKRVRNRRPKARDFDLPTQNRVETPYGPAIQDDAAEALRVRTEVQQGGTVYKGGVVGRSETGASQFLATENPLNPGYAERFGIPPENANFEFILKGKMRPGAPVVTRPAPGIAPNPGGGIEAVIDSGEFMIESFHMR